MDSMKILNLGWGIQSFTIAAMVALGELEPIDAAIHADTTHERSATYDFAACWTPWLEARGVRVVTVRPDKTMPINNGFGWPEIPAFAASLDGGNIQRQCTGKWKIKPIRRWIHEERKDRLIARLSGLEDGLPNKLEPVEQWLGISLDEAERMKPSDVQYITARWPLIEKRMTRNACIAWLRRHDLEVPVKSSCVFCPYHNRRAWYDMKDENGADWQKAVKVDEAIRKVRPPFNLFVHPDRIPLIDISTPKENGQLDMFSEECSGTCFV
jgi:hypothetical protein